MRIFIIGYMGSGKSTFGPELADALNIPFYDLDIEFESRYKISITDFFHKYGEKYFREIERNLLHEIGKHDDFVLAAGGGTPCYHQNMDFMNRTGITVYLKVPINTLKERLKASPRKRPVLGTFDGPDYEQHLRDHLNLREPFYLQAQIILDGSNPEPAEVSEMIRLRVMNIRDG